MLTRRNFVYLLGSAPLMAQAPATAPEMEWHDARQFNMEGLGFTALKSPYDRLPAAAEGVVRDAVWDLSRESSGVLVRFTADTPMIQARWTLTKKTFADANITAIAASGLDLYAKTDAGRWHWLGVARPKEFPQTTNTLAEGLRTGSREYMIYLPLRNGVASLEIGVPKGSAIGRAAPRATGSKPIVFYGTSITHGISASRSGMTHVAILGRVFNREVINLGFAGNGRMEPEVTRFVAELDPAVFVLDCLPNMSAKDINERAEACVKILRAAHPETPILLVEDRNLEDGFLVPARREVNEANHAAMRAVYAQMERERIPHLYYLKGDNLLGDDGEGTIDSSHPTDLGFTRQAAEFEKALRKILK